MSAIKQAGEPVDDAFYQYLDRSAQRGIRLQRLETLLRQMNMQAASLLEATKSADRE